MDAIDVSIVAGRRPDLLERTLASFEENLFRNFEIARVIANIDPIFGDEADHLKCIDLIRAMDSDALVSEPEEPGFGAAVKRTWSSTQASVILHLEDDWLLNYPITPKDIAIFDSEPRVMQAAFNHHYKFWDTRERGPYRVARRRIKVLGYRNAVQAPLPGLHDIARLSPRRFRAPMRGADEPGLRPGKAVHQQEERGPDGLRIRLSHRSYRQRANVPDLRYRARMA